MESGTKPARAGGDSQIARVLPRTVALVTTCPNTHADPAPFKNPTPLKVTNELPFTGPWHGSALMIDTRA